MFKTTEKTCPSCESTFQCSGDNNCWCMKIKITPKAAEQIDKQYTDCLCKNCIENLNKLNGK